jgi:hypothetical protein
MPVRLHSCGWVCAASGTSMHSVTDERLARWQVLRLSAPFTSQQGEGLLKAYPQCFIGPAIALGVRLWALHR